MATKTASARSKTQSFAGVHIPENFEEVCKTGLDDVFKRNLERPKQGKSYFKERNMTKRTETFLSYYGLGEVQQTTDVENIPADEFGLGFDWTLTNNIFKGKINITKELIEDEQYGVINDRQQELSESYHYSQEIVFADVFNRALGASGAPILCEDGMYLGDDDRPNPYTLAGTWSNLESAGALTPASIFQTQLNFRGNRNERGQLRPLKLGKIVIRPAEEKSVWEILNSVNEPGTSLNTKNYQANRFTYEVYDYLTAAIAFFTAEDTGGAKNELYYGNRISPELRTWWEEDVMVQRVRGRYGVGCGRPHTLRFQDIS